MSVETVATVRRRPYPNPRNIPGLPVAIWFAQAGLLGDGTGGHAEIAIDLNPASTIRSGKAWSVEVSIPTIDGTASLVFRMATINLDVLGPGLTNAILKAFTQNTQRASSTLEFPDGAVEVRDLHPRLYLGTQGAAATSARLQGQWANTDTVTYGWYASGYEWEPAALNFGAIKPIDGLL